MKIFQKKSEESSCSLSTHLSGPFGMGDGELGNCCNTLLVRIPSDVFGLAPSE